MKPPEVYSKKQMRRLQVGRSVWKHTSTMGLQFALRTRFTMRHSLEGVMKHTLYGIIDELRRRATTEKAIGERFEP